MAPAAEPRSRGRRRLKAVVFGVLLGLFVLEVVLQVSHLVVCLLPRDAGTTAAGGRTVLCVGDSFTYGIGASGPESSYPAVVGRELSARFGETWSVANEGWPGRNSRELLFNLGAQIDRRAPDAVCILVGVNDRWSHPPRLEAGAEFEGNEARGFQLRWRTRRLLSLLLMSEDRVDPAAVLVGAWAMIGERIDIGPDGAGTFRGAPMTWRAEGDAIAIEVPGVLQMAATWRGDGSRLQIIPANGAAELTLERLDDRARVRMAAALGAIEDGDEPLAQRLMRGMVRLTRDDDPWAVALRRRAHRVAVATGDAESAAAHAAWLQRRSLDSAETATALAAPRGPYVHANLEDHLRRAIKLCEQRGALPVLITYPKVWGIHAVHERVAADLGVELVVTKPLLDAALAAEPGAELFVADGHCNDRGYALMAKAVAAAIERAVKSR